MIEQADVLTEVLASTDLASRPDTAGSNLVDEYVVANVLADMEQLDLDSVKTAFARENSDLIMQLSDGLSEFLHPKRIVSSVVLVTVLAALYGQILSGPSPITPTINSETPMHLVDKSSALLGEAISPVSYDYHDKFLPPAPKILGSGGSVAASAGGGPDPDDGVKPVRPESEPVSPDTTLTMIFGNDIYGLAQGTAQALSSTMSQITGDSTVDELAAGRLKIIGPEIVDLNGDGADERSIDTALMTEGQINAAIKASLIEQVSVPGTHMIYIMSHGGTDQNGDYVSIRMNGANVRLYEATINDALQMKDPSSTVVLVVDSCESGAEFTGIRNPTRINSRIYTATSSNASLDAHADHPNWTDYLNQALQSGMGIKAAVRYASDNMSWGQLPMAQSSGQAIEMQEWRTTNNNKVNVFAGPDPIHPMQLGIDDNVSFSTDLQQTGVDSNSAENSVTMTDTLVNTSKDTITYTLSAGAINGVTVTVPSELALAPHSEGKFAVKLNLPPEMSSSAYYTAAVSLYDTLGYTTTLQDVKVTDGVTQCLGFDPAKNPGSFTRNPLNGDYTVKLPILNNCPVSPKNPNVQYFIGRSNRWVHDVAIPSADKVTEVEIVIPGRDWPPQINLAVNENDTEINDFVVDPNDMVNKDLHRIFLPLVMR